MRKYVDVPSNEEITQQYNYLVSIVKNIKTVEQVIEFSNKYTNIEVEINYDSMKDFLNRDEDEIETIRYEYKNIMMYVDIEDGEVEIPKKMYLFTDDGFEIGYAPYDSFDTEIEKLYNEGFLERSEC